MSFRFKVSRVARVAGVCTLDGILLEGQITHGAIAYIQMGQKLETILVETVAFVSPARGDRAETTITIAPPPFELSLLAGAELRSANTG